MNRTLQTTLLSFLFFSLSSQVLFTQNYGNCDCLALGNCPAPINDSGSFSTIIPVNLPGTNDLGNCPLEEVCFSITHTWIGDLSVHLTSPSGKKYLLMADANNNYGGCGMQQDNVDICIVPGTGNPLTNNTEYQCNAAPCSSPSGICCLTDNWTMPCGGVQDPLTGAIQAPNCDLNDFNVSGDPTNGNWVLTVNDVCNMDTGSLENFSLKFSCNSDTTCTGCLANGGDEIDNVSFFENICEGSEYIFNGETITTAGEYTAAHINMHGCDSIENAHFECFAK